MTCFDGLYLKNCVLLAAFWDKILYIIWAKQSSALHTVMILSARSTTLL